MNGEPPASGARASRTSQDDGAALPDAAGAPAYEAVNDAYRVIDEYLRQGQEFAQRAWMPIDEVPTPMPGGGHSLERMMRATGDLAMAWLGFLQQLSVSPPGAAGDAPAWPGAFATDARGGGANGHAKAATPEPLGVTVVVDSERPVAVRVDLQRDAEPGTLTLGTLTSGALTPEAVSSADGNVPVLHDIALENSGSEHRLTVRIRIESSQPSGVYNGLLLDPDGAARGTLSVRLS